MQICHLRPAVVLFAALIAGCATPVSTNIQPTAAHVAKYNELAALDVVSTLEKNVNDAKSAGMPFLAPNYYREAAQVLSDCQSALGNKSREVLVNNAAKGEAILEKGRAVMDIVKYRFAKELEYKAQLDEHNASKLLPKEYEAVIGELSGLIEKVEREQPDNIDAKKEALQKSMLDLVIKAVQEGALRESETINLDSKKKNADKQAPITYAEALRVYQDAKAAIAAAHHDKALVQRKRAEALFAAHHAQQVNDRVAQLQAQLKISAASIVPSGSVMAGNSGAQVAATTAENKPAAAATDKATLEMIVLQEEGRLHDISTALGLDDQRDHPLDKQVAEIKRAAESVRHTGKGIPAAPVQDYEARLQAANESIQQMSGELSVKDKQIAEKDGQLAAKDKLLETQAAQLADKDEQIKKFKDRVDRLEWEKPAEPVKAAKPKKAKAAAAEKK
jgi:hypothetical protein